jgi:prepilin-type N-terminal cleavage/methylation domain-containing protein
MNNRGITLLELLIVVVVLGIVGSFGVVAVGNIVENTAKKVDQENAEILEDVIKTAAVDGTLIIQSNRLYNTSSNRAYSGTGSWFFEDMKGYIDNRVRPQSEVAKNNYNKDGDSKYKFLFSVKNGDIEIFYYDSNKTKIVLVTFRID